MDLRHGSCDTTSFLPLGTLSCWSGGVRLSFRRHALGHWLHARANRASRQCIEMLLRQGPLECINRGELRRPHANHLRSRHIPRQIVDEDAVVWGAAELRDDALKRGDLPFRLTHLTREKAPFKDG
jgi:hypothetical protein